MNKSTLMNIQQQQKTITLGIPNRGTMIPTKECILELPKLHSKAIDIHILEGLTYSSLVSIGNMHDAEWKAVFTKTNVHIIKDENIFS